VNINKRLDALESSLRPVGGWTLDHWKAFQATLPEGTSWEESLGLEHSAMMAVGISDRDADEWLARATVTHQQVEQTMEAFGEY
jgi:glycine cleavage system aminomethyltransferase T